MYTLLRKRNWRKLTSLTKEVDLTLLKTILHITASSDNLHFAFSLALILHLFASATAPREPRWGGQRAALQVHGSMKSSMPWPLPVLLEGVEVNIRHSTLKVGNRRTACTGQTEKKWSPSSPCFLLPQRITQVQNHENNNPSCKGNEAIC